MTMYKPNLRIEHLSIFKGGKAAYSENFHSGLNIIRGENSSGKSTLMDFMFYGLGGDLQENQWRETAAICDHVVIGASLNNSRLTLSREVDTKSSRPMRIFMGPWEEALQSGGDGWERFPYRRGDKESFSQALFRWLGLPEVQHENENTKITMNQVLRLLYSDQLSPVEKIFRNQTFDDATTRQIIGDLLCGAYSDEFYRAKLRLKVASDEIVALNSRKTFLVRTHGKDGHPLNMIWLDQERANLDRQIAELNSQIEEIEKSIFDAQFEDRLSLNDQRTTYDRVVNLQEAIGELTEQLNETRLESDDSANFMAALKIKTAQLQESGAVVEQFKNLSFQFCPACLAPVKSSEVDGACDLCKSAYDHDLTKRRAVKLINEYQRQLEQSEQIQTERVKEIALLERKIIEKTELWEQAGKHYRVALRTPTTELRTRLRDLNRRAGYSYRNLEELALKRAIIEELEGLNRQLVALDDEVVSLKNTIANQTKRMTHQKVRAYEKVENTSLWFLKHDLERQSSFAKADRFSFEFDSDRLSVNGESYFSASSMVIMRNSFLASFLFAAANDSSFSHPRLLIMDTVEDKGMEPERSRNFQRLLAEKSSEAESEHQIIIATSMIAPELENPKYTIGDFYTHENRTLRIQA